jgi:hypothetical protein
VVQTRAASPTAVNIALPLASALHAAAALRDSRFARPVAALRTSLEPAVGNAGTLSERRPISAARVPEERWLSLGVRSRVRPRFHAENTPVGPFLLRSIRRDAIAQLFAWATYSFRRSHCSIASQQLPWTPSTTGGFSRLNTPRWQDDKDESVS